MDDPICPPARIILRCPFPKTAGQLPNTPSQNVTPLSQVHSMAKDPPLNQPRSRVEALALARVAFMRHGYIPDYFRPMLSGPIDDPVLEARWDKKTGGIFTGICKQARVYVSKRFQWWFSNSNRSSTSSTAAHRLFKNLLPARHPTKDVLSW
jgi:hypothetical protein